MSRSQRDKGARGESPTSRSLKAAREMGYIASADTCVERRINRTLKKDWLGVADHIWPHPDGHVLAVQITSGSNHAARLAKVLDLVAISDILRSGMRFEVWSWAKRGPRGARKIWKLRRNALRLREGVVWVEDP